jgi:putative salt-induced outer membrane protein YdiY
LLVLTIFCAVGPGAIARAQTAAPEPPPLWDLQLGAAFVGTGGNSETATAGADFSMHRRWPLWQIESTASAVTASDRGVQTTERYVGAFRMQRKLTSLIGLTAGERIERDRFAGVSLRSILDAGLSYALVQRPRWTLDGLSTMAWSRETPFAGDPIDDAVAVLQLLSKVPFAEAAEATQRFTFYPNFSDGSAHRSEAEFTAQAAMNRHLALRLGYLWRRANEPVAGFEKDDRTVTASIVVQWRAATPAP